LTEQPEIEEHSLGETAWHKFDVATYAMSRGAFVHFPTTVAKMAELASAGIKHAPKLWDGEALEFETLNISDDTYAAVDGFYKWVEQGTDENGSPILRNDADVTLSTVGEVAGEAVALIGVMKLAGAMVPGSSIVDDAVVGSLDDIAGSAAHTKLLATTASVAVVAKEGMEAQHLYPDRTPHRGIGT